MEKVEKLPGPREIPAPVQKYLATEKKISADIVKFFKVVNRPRLEQEGGLNARVYDPSEAIANGLEVKNYTSFDEHQNLILYEGWYDERAQHIELEEKKKAIYETPILTEAEIQQKIDALTEPGSTTLFYLARGAGYGGPLGQGAAIVELNPNKEGKKGKKYNVYTVNVINMEPAGERRKLFDSDKSKQITDWIKQSHHARTY